MANTGDDTNKSGTVPRKRAAIRECAGRGRRSDMRVTPRSAPAASLRSSGLGETLVHEVLHQSPADIFLDKLLVFFLDIRKRTREIVFSKHGLRFAAHHHRIAGD